MSEEGSGGMPQEQQQEQAQEQTREHRMRQGAKKQVHRAEDALHKYRAKAAAILHAEGLHGEDAEAGRKTGYVYKILRHRETGVRVKVLDCDAPDAPEPAKAAVHRYAVECETHGTRGDSYVSAKAALAAARRSYAWCSPCSDLMGSQPKQHGRARLTGKHTHHGDFLP